MYHSLKSLDENFYMCETYHKYLYKKEILCQDILCLNSILCLRNKNGLKKILIKRSYTRRVNALKKEKVLISRIILFKKIAIIHGKDRFSKIIGSNWNIPVEVENICNLLPRPAVSSGLIVFKLK